MGPLLMKEGRGRAVWLAGLAAFLTSAVPVGALPEPTGPVCRTLDARDAPATLFAPGDPVVVTGQNLPAASNVDIRFVEETETYLATVTSDRAGRVSSRAVAATIPEVARSGPAGIRLSAGGSTATCAIQVLVSALRPVSASGGTGFMALWGAVLVVLGSFLAVVSWRRWRASRLAAVVTDPGTADGTEEWAGAAFIDDDAVGDLWTNSDDQQDAEEPANDPHAGAPVDPARQLVPSGMSSTVARLMTETRGWTTR